MPESKNKDRIKKYQCGFWKGFSAQHLLIAMTEKWRQSLDSSGQAVLNDLLKGFDGIDHELLIAKLNAYRFNNSILTFIYSYLSERKQRTKINSSFSCWGVILFGVPEDSVLGPLLFNAYICDLFFEVRYLEYTSVAVDTTPYTCVPEMIPILGKCEKVLQSMFD